MITYSWKDASSSSTNQFPDNVVPTYRSRFSRVLRLGRIIGRLKSVPFKTIQVAWIWIPLLVLICVLVWISVAEIKYHNPKQLTEKKIYYGLQFQKYSVHHGGKAWHGNKSNKLDSHIFIYKREEESMNQKCCKAKLSKPIPNDVHPPARLHLLTLPSISKQCHLVGTECLNR